MTTRKVELMDFENRETVLRRMMQRANASNLPGVAEGQTLRNMGNLFADELQSQNNRIQYAMSSSLPSTATGPNLDMIGESTFGLQRIGASYAQISVADQNVMFFVTNGSLVDYLPLATNGRRYIPKGTLVSDGRGNDYNTISHTYVTPGQTQAYVSAKALISGKSRNVPSGVMTVHNLDQRVSCNNRFDISNGADIESDQNYRYRIMNAHLALQGGNVAAINNAVASVPGVSQFNVEENFNGPGTVEVLVVPTGNRLSPGTKRNVEASIRGVIPACSIVVVREPTYVEWELAITIVRRSSVDGATSVVRRQATEAIMNYFNSLPLAPRIDTNEMLQYVRTTLSRYGVSDIKLTCFLVNQQAVRPGVVRFAKRDLLVPSPFVSEPVKVLVA